MIPDAECLKIMSEILTELKIGDYKIKVLGFFMGGAEGGARLFKHMCFRSTIEGFWTGCLLLVEFLVTNSSQSVQLLTSWTRLGCHLKLQLVPSVSIIERLQFKLYFQLVALIILPSLNLG